MSACDGKVAFFDEREVRAALGQALTRRLAGDPRHECSAYHCHHCDLFHLSSMQRADGRIVAR